MDSTMMQQSLSDMLGNWERMQTSELDEAGEAADRFQTSFYAFIDCFRDWFEAMSDKPSTFDAAREVPEISTIIAQLPIQLQLNFDTELELIVEGSMRDEDDAT